MGVNWTKEQRQVIESRDRNLLVSAAAGSGKTAVLVERIIRMITDGERPGDIERLLVMTFTKAAASEMRERIHDAIEKKLKEDPGNEHLQQQAIMVQYAQITTIDSFCLHILREHFDCLDIDPAFRVGDEGEMLLLRGDVMEELLEDWYGRHAPAFENFVETYSSGKADGGIDDYIYQVYSFSQSNPWPKEWIDECRRELSDTSVEALDRTGWMQFLLEDVRRQASEWAEQLQEAARLCSEEDGPGAYLPMILSDLSNAEKLREVSGYDSFVQAASGFEFPKLAAVRGKHSPVNSDKKEKVSECRKRIKKAVEKMKGQFLFASEEEILADLAGSSEAVLMLLTLAEDFAGRFEAKKRERNLVDFNDLEHLALQVLYQEEKEGGEHRPSEAADLLAGQFDEILVDEYQDSNLVQEALIRAVSRERFGTPNVFMVGDVKQSIYKFRLARPELFLEKYHSYTKEDSLYQKIELHQNFRSRRQVLESTNDVFYRIMTENLGSISYTEETALHPGASFEPLPQERGRKEAEFSESDAGQTAGEAGENGPLQEQRDPFSTEILLINTKDSVLEELDDDISDYTRQELEARMIGKRIRELTDPERGCPVWDKELGCYRKAEYRDIVILLRSVSGWAESFVETLAHQGIPAFAESKTGYFTTIEVETMLNFLAVLDNPMQDIPLTAVLKAPFFGLTDRELAEIAARFKHSANRGQDRGMYGAICLYLGESDQAGETMQSSAEEEREPEILEKLASFFRVTEQLRREAVYLPIHELIYRIFDVTGYYDYVSAMPAGETRRANLDMLVEKAAAYEATSYRGVFHFIKYIEKLKKYNTDFGEASTAAEGGNTVRIMSIHKSKGLEFPIVFVAAMGKQFNRQDTRGKILIDSRFGIGTDYLNAETRLKAPTLKKNVLKRRMDLENMGEELRVLYVAMTRAKEKLILTASDRNLEAKLEKWKELLDTGERGLAFTLLSLAGSYLDWVLMAMEGGVCRIWMREVMAKELLSEEIGEQVRRKVTKDMLLWPDREEEGEESPASQIFGMLGDEEYRKRLEESFSFQYPWEDELRLNTKMSVSDIKKEGDEELFEESAFLPTIPSFLSGEEKEVQGARRGTAYHRAMELLSFHEIRKKSDIKEQLDRFVEEGKMTADSRELVRESVIWPFFSSDLGKRMAAAQREGRLKKESQFVIGIPARQMGDFNSDELVLVQGIIDAFFEEDGELVLVDYKTDYVEKEETLRERYGIQLDYYRRALMQMEKKRVKETVIYSFRLGEVRLQPEGSSQAR